MGPTPTLIHQSRRNTRLIKRRNVLPRIVTLSVEDRRIDRRTGRHRTNVVRGPHRQISVFIDHLELQAQFRHAVPSGSHRSQQNIHPGMQIFGHIVCRIVDSLVIGTLSGFQHTVSHLAAVDHHLVEPKSRNIESRLCNLCRLRNRPLKVEHTSGHSGHIGNPVRAPVQFVQQPHLEIGRIRPFGLRPVRGPNLDLPIVTGPASKLRSTVGYTRRCRCRNLPTVPQVFACSQLLFRLRDYDPVDRLKDSPLFALDLPAKLRRPRIQTDRIDRIFTFQPHDRYILRLGCPSYHRLWPEISGCQQNEQTKNSFPVHNLYFSNFRLVSLAIRISPAHRSRCVQPYGRLPIRSDGACR